MLGSKPKSYLGVDLGAGGVKLVELRVEKKRPLLHTYGLTVGSQDVHRLLEKRDATVQDMTMGPNKKPIPTETFSIDQTKINDYADLLRTVCQDAKTVSKTAVVSLPVSSIFHAVVTMPIIKKEDFERVLKAEIKKLLPYPLEEMVVDYDILHHADDAKSQRVLVNAVPRALVVFYTETFKKAGLILDALEPESVALTRSLVGHDTAVTLLIDIGAERTNFFIVDEAVPVTHHTIEMGGQRLNGVIERTLGIPASATEQVKKDVFTAILTTQQQLLTKDQFGALFNPVIDPILKEIEYSLELYMRQSANINKHPEKVVLTGGGSLFPYLADCIANKFKLRSYIGDPWGRIVYPDSLKPVLREVAPRLSVAIGLALRNMV